MTSVQPLPESFKFIDIEYAIPTRIVSSRHFYNDRRLQKVAALAAAQAVSRLYTEFAGFDSRGSVFSIKPEEFAAAAAAKVQAAIVQGWRDEEPGLLVNDRFELESRRDALAACADDRKPNTLRQDFEGRASVDNGVAHMTAAQLRCLLERALIALRETGTHAGAAAAIGRHTLELNSLLMDAAGIAKVGREYFAAHMHLDPPPTRPAPVDGEARSMERRDGLAMRVGAEGHTRVQEATSV